MKKVFLALFFALTTFAALSQVSNLEKKKCAPGKKVMKTNTTKTVKKQQGAFCNHWPGSLTDTCCQRLYMVRGTGRMYDPKMKIWLPVPDRLFQ